MVKNKFETELDLDLFIARFILNECNQGLPTIDCEFEYSITKMIADTRHFLISNNLVHINKK